MSQGKYIENSQRSRKRNQANKKQNRIQAELDAYKNILTEVVQRNEQHSDHSENGGFQLILGTQEEELQKQFEQEKEYIEQQNLQQINLKIEEGENIIQVKDKSIEINENATTEEKISQLIQDKIEQHKTIQKLHKKSVQLKKKQVESRQQIEELTKSLEKSRESIKKFKLFRKQQKIINEEQAKLNERMNSQLSKIEKNMLKQQQNKENQGERDSSISRVTERVVTTYKPFPNFKKSILQENLLNQLNLNQLFNKSVGGPRMMPKQHEDIHNIYEKIDEQSYQFKFSFLQPEIFKDPIQELDTALNLKGLSQIGLDGSEKQKIKKRKRNN